MSGSRALLDLPEVGTPAEGRGLRAATARLTRYGMDCYAYALVAAGQIDLVVEAGLQAAMSQPRSR
ncbi:MAG: hypothetical protein R3D78_01265 [Paracoccaceae bacterium]